ncbi:MAG: HDOD domain-containing protein, partial [Gemmatimonadota bacterium]
TSVLRVCRAAFYGFRGNTIELAITFLGVEKIRSIVQAAIIFNVFATTSRGPQDEEFSPLELWKHSVAVGIIMEQAGQQVKGRDHFIAGMLHDIGKLIIYLRFPDHFAEIRRMVREEHQTMYDAERALLGVTHAEIGYELARKWDLPPTISTAIAHHHHPSAALQHRRLSSLVHVADLTARTLDIGHGGDKETHRMDEVAGAITRHVAAAADRKDEIAQQVESMVAEYHVSAP